MADRYKRWLIQLCLAALMAGGWPPAAQAEDTLIWLLRDLPPLTILEGPSKGLSLIHISEPTRPY